MPALRTPTHPEMVAAIEACIDSDRGYLLGLLDGDEVLHLNSTDERHAELMIYRRGTLYRVPMDERLSPKVAFRLWRATRVAFMPCTALQSG